MWKRFIDIVFFIWSDSEENLEKFLKELNGFHPNIKFTFGKSKMKVNFLDVVTEIKNGRLTTDLCSKLVDSYQYLHYNSCHEEHIKKLSFTVNFKVKKNFLMKERSRDPYRRPKRVVSLKLLSSMSSQRASK